MNAIATFNGPQYPASAAARDRWILEERGPKNPLDPSRPYAYTYEEEIGPGGDLVSTATAFLTNRECPYRCLMCDLWQNTLDATVPIGAIPEQIRFAISQLPPARQIKLYNAGSFFDPRAIPTQDHPAIAGVVADFERVIVECHPALVKRELFDFASILKPHLEVAMGLETAHPEVLEKLNKRMTLEGFRSAGQKLSDAGVDLRVFILVQPPFLNSQESIFWACRSLEFAFDCGAAVCSLIPTRDGNGAMEALERNDSFSLPTIEMIEQAVEYGLSLKRGRVFADLWDIQKFYRCECSQLRADRLAAMNLTQAVPEPVVCPKCGEGAA